MVKLQVSSWAAAPDSQAVGAQASWRTPQPPDAPSWTPQSDQTPTADGAQRGSWGTQEQPWQRQQQHHQVADVGGWDRAADAKVEGNLTPPVEAAVTGRWGETVEAKVKGASKETVAQGDWGQAAVVIDGDWAAADPTQGGKAEVGQRRRSSVKSTSQHKSMQPEVCESEGAVRLMDHTYSL